MHFPVFYLLTSRDLTDEVSNGLLARSHPSMKVGDLELYGVTIGEMGSR